MGSDPQPDLSTIIQSMCLSDQYREIRASRAVLGLLLLARSGQQLGRQPCFYILLSIQLKDIARQQWLVAGSWSRVGLQLEVVFLLLLGMQYINYRIFNGR